MTTRRRNLVQLTGDDACDLPGDAREQVFAWARRNGLTIPDRERPIAAITVDPAGRESFLFVTEVEMDTKSDYITHVRKVRMTEPLPGHLIGYFTPLLDAGVVETFRIEEGGVYGGLPGATGEAPPPGGDTVSLTVGTMTRPYEVHVRPVRSGWRRFWRPRAWNIGTVTLKLPVHAEATDEGDVTMQASTAGEIFRALGDGLRDLADEADRLAGEETP